MGVELEPPEPGHAAPLAVVGPDRTQVSALDPPALDAAWRFEERLDLDETPWWLGYDAALETPGLDPGAVEGVPGGARLLRHEPDPTPDERWRRASRRA